jgi:hypothetical protein
VPWRWVVFALSQFNNSPFSVKNEIKLTEEDVNIVNEKGNKVYFIKAPGNYSLHFKVGKMQLL